MIMIKDIKNYTLGKLRKHKVIKRDEDLYEERLSIVSDKCKNQGFCDHCKCDIPDMFWSKPCEGFCSVETKLELGEPKYIHLSTSKDVLKFKFAVMTPDKVTKVSACGCLNLVHDDNIISGTIQKKKEGKFMKIISINIQKGNNTTLHKVTIHYEFL